MRKDLRKSLPQSARGKARRIINTEQLTVESPLLLCALEMEMCWTEMAIFFCTESSLFSCTTYGSIYITCWSHWSFSHWPLFCAALSANLERKV